MMKRILLPALLFFTAISVFAELTPVAAGPLANNAYYRKSVELANQAQKAMDAADYEAAAAYAVESQRYAALSRQFIEQALAAMNRGGGTQGGGRTQSGGTGGGSQGGGSGGVQDGGSQAGLQYEGTLAAEYEVKYNPARRDCLWRIAGYTFIYGDPREWRHLYDHNKSSFRYPDNPDLIYPGQILEVPSINGEIRSGRR
ncbi:MAG: hypothetical protein LBQ44_08860 [Treponema sp.]|jgi:nucleoid-associated protein YgaU|nr:hypothetical protein [Treponema sp.]